MFYRHLNFSLYEIMAKVRIVRWSLDYFLKKCEEIHGREKFIYTRINRDCIRKSTSLIDVICAYCLYEWEEPVDDHLKRDKCPNLDCSDQRKPIRKWTLDLFLEHAWRVRGNEFDYSLVKEEHISDGQKSKIPITCKTCGYSWSPSIVHHINTKRGCPDCSKQARWTLERFLKKAKEVHDDKYDYSQVNEVLGKDTKVPIRCNQCGYQWTPSVHNHINGKYGCPECSGNVKWTLERLVRRAKEIHEDSVNYDLITNDHVKGGRSKIPLICNACNTQWSPAIQDHINYKSGCPQCKISKGEEECSKSLSLMGITFIREFCLPELPRKRFDFYFEYNKRKYLLEFDGRQHFEEVYYFHNTCSFKDRQDIDFLKTKVALELGYMVIRIDYTQINRVREHIEQALNSDNYLYVSNIEMYRYITILLHHS